MSGVDAFLAGLNLDSDTDDDEPPLPPPKRPPSRPLKNIRGGVTFAKDLIKQGEARKARRKQEDGYGSIAWQKSQIGAGVPTKILDCVVYIYDEDDNMLRDPSFGTSIAEWMGEGMDPDWWDQDTHNELKEKYNQNIKKKAGKFNGCY